MDKTLLTCREFTAALASSAPAPGGGGAAALCGALGAALAHMVGALTLKKPRGAAEEAEIRALTERLETLITALEEQVPADEEGFLPLAAVYRLPKEAPERAQLLEDASCRACAVPLRILELSAEAVDCAGTLAEKGSALVVSDAGCAAALLKSAMEAAALNVFINTKGLRDREKAAELNGYCLRLLRTGCEKAGRIYGKVKAGLLPAETV